MAHSAVLQFFEFANMILVAQLESQLEIDRDIVKGSKN